MSGHSVKKVKLYLRKKNVDRAACFMAVAGGGTPDNDILSIPTGKGFAKGAKTVPIKYGRK